MSTAQFRINGRIVKNGIQQSVSNLRVEAWDKDLICDDLVGSAVSDSEGKFQITFDQSYFKELFFDRKPDLYFKVYRDDQLICETSDSVLWNIKTRNKKVTISVDATDGPSTDTPSVLSKTDLQKIQQYSSKTPQELEQAEPELYKTIAIKATGEIRSRVLNHFGNASAQLEAKLQRLTLSDITDSQQDLKAYLEETLLDGEVSEELRTEISKSLNTLVIPDSLSEAMQMNMPLDSNPVFEGYLKQAAVLQLSNFAGLDDKIANSIAARGIAPAALNARQLESLVSDKVLTSTDANRIAGSANLYQWADGNFDLMEAVKAKVSKENNKPFTSLQDMLPVLNTRGALKELIVQSNIVLPDNLDADAYAESLHLKLQRAFPGQAFKQYYQNIVPEDLQKNLSKVIPLLANNSDVFGNGSVNMLNFGSLKKAQIAGAKTALTSIRQKINRFPGMQLASVLADTQVADSDKIAETVRRIGLIAEFYQRNPSTLFLTLDFTPGSADIDALDFGKVDDEDKIRIVKTLRSYQRVWNVAGRDAELAHTLMEAGYHSANDIASRSKKTFINSSGLDPHNALLVHEAASNLTRVAGFRYGTILDELFGKFRDTGVDNSSREIDDYLHRLPGVGNLLAAQGYCRCEHCASIISPAAYYVDLMDYVERYITEPNFSRPELRDHGMRLDQRRPDLWELSLSCDATNTLVPYLKIINEILENYIYRNDTGAGTLPSRTEIEEHVYQNLLSASARIHSFEQPFNLPLTRLTTYLSHFPATRRDIVTAVLDGNDDPDNILVQSILNLSNAEYQLISMPNTDGAFLNRLYGHTVPERDENIQRLLPVMGISREELAELVKTQFVVFDTSVEIVVHGERSAGSTQIDIEYIDGLTATVLDRMHRFVRLWKKVSWSIAELDLMLSYLDSATSLGNIPIDRFAWLYLLQQEFKIPVEELCALIGSVPRIAFSVDSVPLFERLFNTSPFARSAAEHWPTGDRFVHPAFLPAGSGIDSGNSVARLIGGLGISDEELLVLIDHLGVPLAVDTDNGFILSENNLSLLYRHVRLARLFGLSISELFQLFSLSDVLADAAVDDLGELQAVYDFYKWWQGSPYHIDELSIITGIGDVALSISSTIDDLLSELRGQRVLIFADTVFSLLDGVTEAQSRRIVSLNSDSLYIDTSTDLSIASLTIPVEITQALSATETEIRDGVMAWLRTRRRGETGAFLDTDLVGLEGLSAAQSQSVVAANAALFVQAQPRFERASLKLYRIRSDLDLSTVTFVLPVSVTDTPELQEALRSKAQTAQAPGALPFGENLFAGVEGLSATQSAEIVAATPAVFEEQQTNNLFWLVPDYDLSVSLIVPDDVPLTIDDAKKFIEKFHVSKILPVRFAELFDISDTKMAALLRLADVDMSDPVVSAPLADIIHGNSNSALLEQIFERLQRLAVLFKDARFNDTALTFIYEQGGTADAILPYQDGRSAGVSVWSPSILEVRMLSLYLELLDLENVGSINDVLLGFDIGSDRFDDTVIAAIAELTNAQNGLVTNLNRLLQFPGDDPTTPARDNPALAALGKLVACIKFARYLGVNGDALLSIASNDSVQINAAADAIYSAFRTKYNEDEWRQKIEPFEDNIREQKRDALSDYILQTMTPSGISPDRFVTTDDLYHWFFIDTELQGCARTSYVVAGLSSLQLYVQRCLMNLEQNDSGDLQVLVDSDGAKQWPWRKNYRVWEANRKVFLWPENYIEPELRDNKTPLFEKLEAELLQRDIDAQAALDAYAGYLGEFDQLARLKIAGAYHDQSNTQDVLHLFGVTDSEPPTYYYRTIKNVKRAEREADIGIVWNPWRKLDVQIPVRKICPIMFHSRLFIFWVDFKSRPKSQMVNGDDQFTGYRHKRSVQFVSLRLDGTWSSPQTVDLDDRRIITESASRVMSDGRRHTEPDDDYTLQGFIWERVMPSVHSDHIQLALPRNGISQVKDWAYNIRELDVFDTEVHDRGARFLRNTSDSEQRLYFRNILNDVFEIDSTLITQDYVFFPYAEADYLAKIAPIEWFADSKTIISSNKPMWLDIVNGALTDGIVYMDREPFYLYKIPSGPDYVLKRLTTSLGERINRILFESGVDTLLSIDTQTGVLGESDLPFDFHGDDLFNDAGKAIDKGVPDFTGPMGVYFREIFFHVPFLIANHLNSRGKFAEAQQWYHYIFNPTSTEHPDLSGSGETGSESRVRDRYWQYVEFRNHTIQSMTEQLGDMAAIAQYQNDPFNPHAIARMRLGAYKKAILMKYIDNLLDWGDHLFAQDTMESIGEATLLYVMAADLLGAKPAELGDCDHDDSKQMRYDDVVTRMHHKSCSELMNSLENLGSHRASENVSNGSNDDFMMVEPLLLKSDPSVSKSVIGAGITGVSADTGASDTGIVATGDFYKVGTDVKIDLGIDDYYKGADWKKAVQPDLSRFIPDFLTNFQRQACEFCIPPNRDLLAYWDRVEDRLYKIRHCMNISGVRRQLSLFAPEIDPMLLVRARAAGISLSDILENMHGELPPYRFSFLVAKAKEYAAACQGFGSALLAALEKKDAEELARLKLVHQDALLKLTSKIKRFEVEAAEASLEALRRRRETVDDRRKHYEDLVNQGLNEWERTQQISKWTGHSASVAAIPLAMLAGITAPLPRIVGFSNSTGTGETTDAFKKAASILQMTGDVSSQVASLAGLEANFQRRGDNWKYSLEQADKDLNELDSQIAAAELRRDIAIQSRDNHELAIEQLDETHAFLRDRFSNLALHTWLSTQLQRFYREAYQTAMRVARLAERAFIFERGGEATDLLENSYWDASHSGLLACEKLLNDLRHMELRYIETNERSFEIDQAFSLTQINPLALLQLKTTGECEFTIPELYFDLFYPGQYRRRIKSARLTIPCITGPYTNVSSTLTLLGSRIRKEAEAGDSKLLEVPPTRTVNIATSTAQNDSGVFRLDFRDERYMPFEGAGAVDSRWKLSLPKNFRTFDYETINDVILHISYTAEYDELFRDEIEGRNKQLETLLKSSGFSLPRVFSLRQEFSQNFHRLLHSPAVTTTVPIELSEQHFPLFLQGRRLSIDSAKLILMYEEAEFLDVSGELPANVAGTFAVTVSANGSGSSTADFSASGNAALLTEDISASVFDEFNPSSEPVTVNFTINDAGAFAPDAPSAADSSALDDHKLKDILLYINYRMI